MSHSSLIASSFFVTASASVSSVSFVSGSSSATNWLFLSHSGCTRAGCAAASSSASCSSVNPSVTSNVVSSRLSTLMDIAPCPPALPSPFPSFARSKARRLARVHSFRVPYCGGVRPLTLASCLTTGAVCSSNFPKIAFKPSFVRGSGGAPSSPPPSWTTSPRHTWHVNCPVCGSNSLMASRLEYLLPQMSGSFVHLYRTLTGPFSTLYLRSACAVARRSCTASTMRL